MDKIILKPTENRNVFETVSSNGVTAKLEAFTATDGKVCLRSVGGNPERVLVPVDPLFWLAFFDGEESVEVEFERKTLE